MNTPGPWRDGGLGNAIVSDSPVENGIGGSDDVAAYGGHLICESVSACNRPIIKAAPDMLAALQFIVEQVNSPGNADHRLGAYRLGAGIAMATEAIAKATE